MHEPGPIDGRWARQYEDRFAMQAPHKTLSFRPRIQLAEDCLRPTRAEIDLEAIATNLGVVRRAAPGARVLAVVKADAYGHGVVPVAHRLEAEGVDGFGVALAEEGIELREAGVGAEIVVLNGVYGGAHRDVLEAGLTPVVYDLGDVDAFGRAAQGAPFDVHVKVDTGMARLGVTLAALDRFLDGLAKTAARVAGVMTHLAWADGDETFTAEQLLRFESAVARIRARGHAPGTLHAANTAGALLRPEARYDTVRPGIALFGCAPGVTSLVARELVPAMRLRTEVIALRDIARGDTVGYERTFTAPATMRVATVPMGYGDGLMRAISSRGAMLVGGQLCPVVGRVSMDLTTLDVSAVPDVGVGAEVVMLGRQGDAAIHPSDLAEAAGTIAYEILTNVSRRVPRVY